MPGIAVIGGSGVYSIDEMEVVRKEVVDTPYGKSPEILIGNVGDVEAAFMPRHGKSHGIPPHKINYRANLWSLKELGVERILATTAVGSLNPSIEPGTFVVIDQFLDFTKDRPRTFYEENDSEVVHIDMTEPYCPELRRVLMDSANGLALDLVDGGTYVCTEGPRFETKAEIEMFSELGADVVGMTNVPESVLARELEICYSTISIVTNYAAGISESKLTHDEVAEIMEENIEIVKDLILRALPQIPKERACGCGSALDGAKVST
ncbi:MAG: S-methyl-5'-thioadenosine phosphorylase [Candidatus Hadarchaeia archaeon]